MNASASDDFLKGLWRENPVLVTLLGMCPTLAVTSSAASGLTMGLATACVLLGSGLVVSSLRGWVPAEVRVATYILVIATLVTAVDYALQALLPALHQHLGAFVALIVVNCVILGRAEAFASRHGVLASLRDGAGMGAGFTLALLIIGTVRELLGSASVFGVRVLPEGFQPWSLMLLPAGGFFALAALLLLNNAWRARRAPAPAAAVTPQRAAP